MSTFCQVGSGMMMTTDAKSPILYLKGKCTAYDPLTFLMLRL